MPKGSCWCKAVSYEYTADPAMKIVCHCLSCQKISGTAFTVNLFVPKQALTVTNGTVHLKTYVQAHESDPKLNITITFCGNCATTLYKHGGSTKFEDYYVVQAGTLDADAEGKKGIDIETPDTEYWTSCRAAWLGEVAGCKQVGGFA